MVVKLLLEQSLITNIVRRLFPCIQASKNTDHLNTTRCFDKMENMSLNKERERKESSYKKSNNNTKSDTDRNLSKCKLLQIEMRLFLTW